MNNTSFFTNVFKSLFGSSITPTASQFVPITAQDGTPAGVSSMANLASVLGASIKYVYNLDTLITAGTYHSTTGATGHPSTGSILVQVATWDNSGLMVKQTATRGNGEIWVRLKMGSEAWGTWRRNDNYGTSSLSELASALGVGGISNNLFKILYKPNTSIQSEKGFLKLIGNFQGLIMCSSWQGNQFNLYAVSKYNTYCVVKSIINGESNFKVYKDSSNNVYIGNNDMQNYEVIAIYEGIAPGTKIDDTSGYTEITTT